MRDSISVPDLISLGNAMNFLRRSVFCLLLFIPAAVLAQTNCEEGASPLNPAQPAGISVEAIIQKFTAQESLFKQEMMHYAYGRDITVQTLDGEMVSGEFRQVSNIRWDRGKMMEYVTFAPQSTLRGISMGKEDFEDINRSPFVLTTEDVRQYNLLYDGQQKVDELETYVFEAAPKQIEKGKRYFQGKVWVDKTDLLIVKTCGKSVPDSIAQPNPAGKKKKKRQDEENISPTVVTYREQIDGKFWFPTYSRSDETIHFAINDARIREIIKYTGYRRSEPAEPSVINVRKDK
jgi:hypothetical protein